ncbi:MULTISPECIES: DUF1178 family protein [unclassified Polaromonas]|uniref:DUF1178 family protein n=1 Tax=unclassified Polaromonas TaxID=2638319 RepID=UPI000F078D38|nr:MULTISPECIES: DUF1178 family protein [unclassified Polaromonas]AYQ29005.1 DUF1178 family protein [Polaromonas sp. SP1]QGJ19876.1 DUF1178 family protein [Polaromonas sp. Pch-P]
MKVLNLQCAHQHSFEGWFASEEDFRNQLSRGLIECPMCADKLIQKLPSAPRLNLGGHAGQGSSGQGSQQTASSDPAVSTAKGVKTSNSVAVVTPAERSRAEQAEFLKALRKVLAHSEDVGPRFAEEARRMHYGELEARNIRGQASVREAAELMDEGIDVIPLPLLPGGNGPLQ